MNQLIPVFSGSINHEQVQLVDARILHKVLQVTSRFNDWIGNRIKEYGFLENQDFINFTKNLVKITRGRPSTDYHLTLDMAKELSMVERTEIGRQVRRYFIQCEKKLQCFPLDNQLYLNNFISNFFRNRFLLTFDGNQEPHIQILAHDACTVSMEKWPSVIKNEPLSQDLLLKILKTSAAKINHLTE